jgi:ceramide glucosyltransferase
MSLHPEASLFKEPAVLLKIILGLMALLSAGLLLWQWLAARRFPLHRRAGKLSLFPPVTLLKPLKGCDEATEACLRSWLSQDYSGRVQVLFGVARAEDPVCAVARRVIAEVPGCDAQLVVCGPLKGANLKVAKLAELEQLARHDLVVVSDADVRVPPDLLANIAALLSEPEAGLACCFYRLANPVTPAMRWEAVAVNADFWSQVLQAQTLKPIDFALGAVMALRRKQLEEIGGFRALADCLADDYQLGNRLVRRGYRIALCPVVVECRSGPMSWREVWKHQLRWARTIRVCQPVPYFFSILSNATLWPLVFAAFNPGAAGPVFALACVGMRVMMAADLMGRIKDLEPGKPGQGRGCAWMAPVKDLLQTVIWLLAFMGNHIEWRGEKLRLERDGTIRTRVQL